MTWRLLLKIGVVALIAAAIGYFSLGYFKQVAVVVPVLRGDAPNAVPGTVTVIAEPRLISSDVAGRIATSSLELSKKVAAGEVLVQLDSSLVQIEIDQTKSDLAAFDKRLELGSPRAIELRNAKDQVAIKQKYFEQNIASEVELELAKRNVQAIEQGIEIETALLKQQRETVASTLRGKELMLKRMTLRSPVDGVVSRIYAQPDALVGNGTTIAEIVPLTRVVEAKISEENISAVTIGKKAQVYFLPYGAEAFDAEVINVLPAPDAQTQRFPVHLKVNIAPERLKPGITGEVTINIDTHPNALLVPRTAIFGGHVYVIEGDRVQLRAVKIGYSSQTLVEVTTGVKEGELVVVENQDLLRDGDRVRVVRRDAVSPAANPK